MAERVPWCQHHAGELRARAEEAEHQVLRLVTIPSYLRELQAGYDATQQKPGESYHALKERYQTCDVLAFADLGAEKLTDWVEEQFYLLVDYQHRQRLPVLASSARKEAQEPRLDWRVMDRLRGMCAMVEVVEPNQRDKGCSAQAEKR